MATVTLSYNHSRDPMNPDDLGNKILQALSLTSFPKVDINPTQIIVTHANVSSGNTAAIQTVIDSYVLDPNWVGGARTALFAKIPGAIQTNIDALALPDPTAGNDTYLGHAAIPAGTLTAAQLSVIVRLLGDQVDSLTRQNTALVAQVRALTRQNTTAMRFIGEKFDSTEGT